MQTTTMAAPPVSADYLSAILNWVCPECGGRMGGRSKEFPMPRSMRKGLAVGLGQRVLSVVNCCFV